MLFKLYVERHTYEEARINIDADTLDEAKTLAEARARAGVVFGAAPVVVIEIQEDK